MGEGVDMNHPRRLLALAPAIAVVIGILAVPASAAVPRCFGRVATIVGTSRDDRLKGTSGRDVIHGRGGDDVIRGLAGNDLLCGGGGSDFVVGNDGRDRLHGGAAPDALQPGAGNDVVVGGGSPLDDVRYPDATGPITASLATGQVTGMGTDTLDSGIEQIVGSPFDDVIEGDDGVNDLLGLDGNDTITALGGEFDLVVGGAGDDALDGGDGFDVAENYFVDAWFRPNSILAGPVMVNLVTGVSTGNGNDTLVDIEGASGSRGNDVMTGDAENNFFVILNEGTDTVDGAAGDDTIDGGDGADSLNGNVGVDTLGNLDATAGMTIDLSTQTDSHGDTLAGFENVLGTVFDDTITGNDASNTLEGDRGADDLFGLGGDDVILGGFLGFADQDADTADGGLGSDACDAETETNCETDPTVRTSPRRASARRIAYHVSWK
jgi:Ca2+-binding RTX toxin-like protein